MFYSCLSLLDLNKSYDNTIGVVSFPFPNKTAIGHKRAHTRIEKSRGRSSRCCGLPWDTLWFDVEAARWADPLSPTPSVGHGNLLGGPIRHLARMVRMSFIDIQFD